MACFYYCAGKCSDPVELTNAVAVGYEDPALEGQNILFTCRPGQMLNGSNTSTCMGNGEWGPDPGEIWCIGTAVTTGATLVTTTAGTSTCYDLHCLLNLEPLSLSVDLQHYLH